MAPRMTRFRNAGLSFDVIDSGPSDGTTVVLLHGFPQTATSWNRLAPHLHERGYRTFAPTQRGYSPGARPRRRRDYRVPLLVDDTLALIHAIGDGPVHLVGHDWGAIVAWATAIGHPDALRTLTSVSVPHPQAFLRSMVRSRQLLRSYYMALFQLPRLPERFLSRPDLLRRAMTEAGMDDEQIAATQREVVDTGAATGALHWYRALPLSGPGAIRGPVTVPTTHVWSTGDIALVRAGAELTRDHVEAEYRLEILDGSHWIPEEHPARLAEIIDQRASAPAEQSAETGTGSGG